jgi:hypothetical protein
VATGRRGTSGRGAWWSSTAPIAGRWVRRVEMLPTGVGGDHAIAKLWNRRGISASSDEDQSRYLHPHPYAPRALCPAAIDHPRLRVPDGRRCALGARTINATQVDNLEGGAAAAASGVGYGMFPRFKITFKGAPELDLHPVRQLCW